MKIETPEDVRKVQKALGLGTQAELADACGITPNLVCQWLSGKRKISKSYSILMNLLLQRMGKHEGV